MSSGRIVQIIGAVIDVEFPRDARFRKVYDALVRSTEAEVTLEVQQQLGDGVVRTIAMGSSEGLSAAAWACENTKASRFQCRSAYRRRWAASWTFWVSLSTTCGEIGAETGAHADSSRKPPTYEEQAAI